LKDTILNKKNQHEDAQITQGFLIIAKEGDGNLKKPSLISILICCRANLRFPHELRQAGAWLFNVFKYQLLGSGKIQWQQAFLSGFSGVMKAKAKSSTS